MKYVDMLTVLLEYVNIIVSMLVNTVSLVTDNKFRCIAKACIAFEPPEVL